MQNDPVNFVDPTGLLLGSLWDFLKGLLVRNDGDGAYPGLHNFEADYWWYGIGISSSGGEDGDGTQQPAPRPRPTPVPAAPNPQQKGFDECAKEAWRSFRKGYLLTSGKAIVGGIGIGLSVGGLGKAGTLDYT